MSKYSDSDPLYTIERGYNEETRMLKFWSTPIGADKLQEALDLIGEYNEFNSRKVGPVLLEAFGNRAHYVVGREYSVCVYVLPNEPWLFRAVEMTKLEEAAMIDEVGVTQRGELRLWWD